MKVVIVTPVKNLIANHRKDYFERLVNSIHQQTYKDITHLLIAGRSTDSTNTYIEKYAKEYPNVQISYQKTKNKWHAMNLGLKEAEGDYIQFLEDDDFFTDINALSTMINKIKEEEAHFCFGPVSTQQDNGIRFLADVHLDTFLVKEPFSLSSMICNMTFAKDMLLFDDEMVYMAPCGFILRAILSGGKGAQIEKPLVAISTHTIIGTDYEKRARAQTKEFLQLDKKILLGFAGITEQELENIVLKGKIPKDFLDTLLMFIHPSFKENIEKNVFEYQHRFDCFSNYIKQGYSTIYVPLVGIGDGLIFSPAARKIFEQTGKKVLIGHKNPEIFKNNPYIEATDAIYDTPEKMTLEDIKILEKMGINVQFATYFLSHPIKNNPRAYFFTLPKEHIIARSCAICGYSGKVEIKPEIYLTEEEKKFGRFFPKNRRQIAIMSAAREPHKQFPYFQEIVNKLKDEYDFIQIGALEDKVLNGIKENMVGKLTIRQTAGVLYNSDLFVGEIGGLMHMARAVDCPAVIAYSGAEPDYLARYIANINVGPEKKCLYSQKDLLKCLPCKQNKDQYCCCRTISVEKMINAIHEQLKRGKENLPVEVIEVEADPLKNSVNEYLRRYNHYFKLSNL